MTGVPLVASVPMLGAFNSWPWWVQLIASAAIALIWSILITWLFQRLGKKRKADLTATGLSARADDSSSAAAADRGAQAIAGGLGAMQAKTGCGDRHQTTVEIKEQKVWLPWLKRPGGPKFTLRPGVDTQQVYRRFHVSHADPQPGD